jgi:hypothetical protein
MGWSLEPFMNLEPLWWRELLMILPIMGIITLAGSTGLTGRIHNITATIGLACFLTWGGMLLLSAL